MPRLLIASAVLISIAAGVYLGPTLRAVRREPSDARSSQTEDGEGKIRTGTSRAALPPRLVTSQAGTLSTNPLDTSYDAARLATAGVKSAKEIFRDEPRDASWAPRMETAISQSVSTDLKTLVPTARDLTIECRTQSCRIEARVATPEDSRKATFALQIGSLGRVLSFPPHKRPFDGIVEVYALQTVSSREIGAWERYNREKRRRFLEDTRKLKPTLPIDIKDLPRD
jgi:hypothetical protein